MLTLRGIVPPKSNNSQNEMNRLQGKHNMMAEEKDRVEPLIR